MARERRYFLLTMGALAAGACSLVYDPDGLRQGPAGSGADAGEVATDGSVSVDGGEIRDAGNTAADGGSSGKDGGNCTSNQDCSGLPTAICDNGQCRKCVADVDCKDERGRICHRGGWCVQCTTDTHCTSLGKMFCNIAEEECDHCGSDSKSIGTRNGPGVCSYMQYCNDETKCTSAKGTCYAVGQHDPGQVTDKSPVIWIKSREGFPKGCVAGDRQKYSGLFYDPGGDFGPPTAATLDIADYYYLNQAGDRLADKKNTITITYNGTNRTTGTFSFELCPADAVIGGLVVIDAAKNPSNVGCLPR